MQAITLGGHRTARRYRTTTAPTRPEKFSVYKTPLAPILSILIFLVSAGVAWHTGDPASVAALMVLAGVVVNSISAYYARQDVTQQIQTNTAITSDVEKKLDTNNAMTKTVAANVVEVKRKTNGQMASDVAEKVAEKLATVAEVAAEKVAVEAAAAAQKIVDAAAKIEADKQGKPETAAAVVSLGQKPPEPK